MASSSSSGRSAADDMSGRRRCSALAALAALCLAGCDPISWTRVTLNQPLAVTDVAFIVPGHTRLDEVVARLGAPDQLVAAGDGFAVNYLYGDSKDFAVNFGWPFAFVSPPSYLRPDFVLGNTVGGGGGFQFALVWRSV